MAADADIALPYRGLGLQEDPRLLCKEPLPLMEEAYPTRPDFLL